ncbi:MAG TPA: response regulator [Vicinamibacterales bacterium]|nr:response regulator [Vicinamibacterales bacterium]
MSGQRKSIVILMADDDPEDRMLARAALAESHLANELREVEDGEQLLHYLRREGKYSDPATSPTPGVILVDLNMPRVDGRTAIGQIKADPQLRHIPIVVLTTSAAETDIFRSYALGVSSYITKPVTFEGLVAVMASFGRYWFEIVELP